MNPHQVSECWSAVKPTHSTSEQQQQQQLVPLHKSVLSLLLVLALYTHRASLPAFPVFMYCLGCALGPCCVYMYSAVSPLLPFVTACSIARQADRLRHRDQGLRKQCGSLVSARTPFLFIRLFTLSHLVLRLDTRAVCFSGGVGLFSWD